MALSIPCLRCRATAQADENAQSLACPSCGLSMPPPGTAAWLVSRGGAQPFGPYTFAQLAGHVSTRMVQPTDSVWHDGAPGWVAVNELSALTVPAPAQPPQPPQPPQPAPGLGQAGAYGGQPPTSQPPTGQPPMGQPQGGQPYGAPPAGGQPYGGASYGGQPPYGQPGFPDPYGPYGPGPHGGPPAVSAGGSVGLHFSRAFDWNLRHLQVDPQEEAILAARNVHDENARRYLVWRRSVLLMVAIPMLVSAVLGILDLFSLEWSGLSALGVLVTLLRVAVLFVLPVTAYLAAQAWADQRRSRRILLIGWIVSIGVPLLLALIPFSWQANIGGAADATQLAQATAVLSLVGAMQAYVTLMPAVLSLIPGVLRGCLRIKALLPQSILPGMFLVAATPLYVLLFMVIFTTVNQVAGHFLLILAVLALAGSSILYLFQAGTFMRPVRTEEEFAKIGSVQMQATIVMTIGLVLMVIWALVAEMFGRSLIGSNPNTSIMRPWDPQLFQLPIEYIARSLFTTVVVADLFMLMNLAMWRNSKIIEGTPEGQNYDRVMNNIEQVGGAGIVSGNTVYREPTNA